MELSNCCDLFSLPVFAWITKILLAWTMLKFDLVNRGLYAFPRISQLIVKFGYAQLVSSSVELLSLS